MSERQGSRSVGLHEVTVALALLWAASLPLSIAVAEASMWLAAVLWGVGWLRRELSADPTRRPADSAPLDAGPAGEVMVLIGTPVMAFWGASVISALVSRNPVESLWELREGFLFVAPIVVYGALRAARTRRWALYAFATGTAIAVGWGFVVTLGAARLHGVSPGLEFRPSGPFGHYMTYAGVLMVAIPVLLSLNRTLVERLAGVTVAVGAVVVLGLTMTRSAWIGCAIGLAVYAATAWVPGRDGRQPGTGRRWAGYGVAILVAVVVGGLLLLTLAPQDALRQRGASIFSLDNPANVDRLAMATTGIALIEAHPVLGIGPGLMPKVYPAWRVDWAVKDFNSHLHNNALQIAAERGLLGLAMWLWMMAAFVVGAWRLLRHAGSRGRGGGEARAALAALAAFLTMGMFEYNFSDSEVLMALLFIISLPFAASAGLAERDRTEDGAGRSRRA